MRISFAVTRLSASIPAIKVNTLTKIKKVTSGSTPEVAQEVDALYASIIEAGTHLAPSSKWQRPARRLRMPSETEHLFHE